MRNKRCLRYYVNLNFMVPLISSLKLLGLMLQLEVEGVIVVLSRLAFFSKYVKARRLKCTWVRDMGS